MFKVLCIQTGVAEHVKQSDKNLIPFVGSFWVRNWACFARLQYKNFPRWIGKINVPLHVSNCFLTSSDSILKNEILMYDLSIQD